MKMKSNANIVAGLKGGVGKTTFSIHVLPFLSEARAIKADKKSIQAWRRSTKKSNKGVKQ